MSILGILFLILVVTGFVALFSALLETILRVGAFLFVLWLILRVVGLFL